jgi:hypothetical protein
VVATKISNRFLSCALLAGGVLAVPLPLGTLTLQPQTKTVAPGCTGNMQNPHVSGGAGGVIAKATFTCGKSSDGATASSIDITLYLCSESVGSVRDSHCSSVATDNNGSTYVDVDATVTRYVPPSGQSGLTKTGYYVAEFVWKGSVGTVICDSQIFHKTS